jgi:hypothetical protein
MHIATFTAIDCEELILGRQGRNGQHDLQGLDAGTLISCFTKVSPQGQRCLEPQEDAPCIPTQEGQGQEGGYGYGYGAEGSQEGGCVSPDYNYIENACVAMSCSADGVLLISGEPCDPGARTATSKHLSHD